MSKKIRNRERQLFYVAILFGMFFALASFPVSAVDVCTIQASAADCTATTGGQVVTYLSSVNNAHGELKSASPRAYGNVLCCNFGSGGTTCTTDNKVLGLSGTTNAHAERPEGTTYTTNKVCYDSLKNCFAAVGATPGTGEIKVATLSAATNAHIGASYTTNVICDVVVAPPTGSCGNNIIDDTEECDPSATPKFRTTQDICSEVSPIYTNGTLNCNAAGTTNECKFNTAQCTPQPPAGSCGNNIIDDTEECDPSATPKFRTTQDICSEVSPIYTNGTLNCNAAGTTNECKFNTAQCTTTPPPACDLTGATWSKATAEEKSSVTLTVTGTNCGGKDVSFAIFEAETGTDDPANINPSNIAFATSGTSVTRTWIAEWKDDGALQGNPEYYFTSSIVGSSPLETISSSELTVTKYIPPVCDGISLCEKYTSQTSCVADGCNVAENSVSSSVNCDAPGVNCRCAWNSAKSECSGTFNVVVPPVCGNGDLETGESCDDGCKSPNNPVGCDAAPLDNNDGCSVTCSIPPPPPTCDNDNTKETGEFCDGTDLNGKTCQSLGYDGGTLACSACGFDVSGCTNVGPYCGDETIDAGEQCDGTEFGPISSCTQFGLTQGTGLACTNNCEINTSTPYCTGTAGPCGNGAINPGETCDGTTFAPAVDSCTKLDNFIGGDLSCDACQIDTLECFDAIDPATEGECFYTADTTDTCEDSETPGLLIVTWNTEWVGAIDPNNPKYVECVSAPPLGSNGLEDAIPCPAQIPLPFFDAYNLIAAVLIIAGVYMFLNTRKKE